MKIARGILVPIRAKVWIRIQENVELAVGGGIYIRIPSEQQGCTINLITAGYCSALERLDVWDGSIEDEIIDCVGQPQWTVSA